MKLFNREIFLFVLKWIKSKNDTDSKPNVHKMSFIHNSLKPKEKKNMERKNEEASSID